MRLFAKLSVIAASAAVMVLPFAGTAFATTFLGGGGNQGNHDPKGNCNNQDNWFSRDGGRNFDPQPISCLPFCHDTTKWVQETTWTWERGHLVREVRWVREDVKSCDNQGNQGDRSGRGGDNGGNQGGGYGGGTCTPVTLDVSSTGTTLVTEISGPVLTNGEEVVYNSVDYYVYGVNNNVTPHTFELVITKNGISPITEGGSSQNTLDWTLETVCTTTV